MIALLLVGSSMAADPLVWPSPPEPVRSECPQSSALIAGQPPPVDLVEAGVVKCSAVAEPTSSMAYLLAVEQYGRAAHEIHKLELEQMQNQIDWYKAELDNANSAKPWWQRSTSQRWIGRFEIVALVGLVGGASWGIYTAAGGAT